MKNYRNHLLALGLGVGTVDLYSHRLEYFGRSHPDLLAVTTADLKNFLAARRTTLGASSRQTYVSAWRSFYRWVAKEHLVAVDPSLELESIRAPRAVPRLAADDVLQYSLLAAPLEEQHMILAGRMGCLRLSEIASLHSRMRRGDLFVVKGKGEKERNIPINDDWMPVVLKMEAKIGRGYYLPGRFGGYQHISTVGRKISTRTGYNPHALRHAGATAAFEATGDLRAVQEFLGHASLATTEIYLHTSLNAVRRVSAGAMFQGAVANPHDVDRIFDRRLKENLVA
ncbi:MAG: tyrosine-type recombinase/integrase [Rhodoglobus sp.]